MVYVSKDLNIHSCVCAQGPRLEVTFAHLILMEIDWCPFLTPLGDDNMLLNRYGCLWDIPIFECKDTKNF